MSELAKEKKGGGGCGTDITTVAAGEIHGGYTLTFTLEEGKFYITTLVVTYSTSLTHTSYSIIEDLSIVQTGGSDASTLKISISGSTLTLRNGYGGLCAYMLFAIST